MQGKPFPGEAGRQGALLRPPPVANREAKSARKPVSSSCLHFPISSLAWLLRVQKPPTTRSENNSTPTGFLGCGDCSAVREICARSVARSLVCPVSQSYAMALKPVQTLRCSSDDGGLFSGWV